jgi:polyphosphate glucokinase
MSAVTLCFDIGGSYIKAGLFDPEARPLSERMRSPTPPQASPKDVLKILKKLAEPLKGYERISAGFPGVVKNGITYTATNLGKGWAGFALASALEKEFSVPVRVANDADVQGLAAVSGKGIELVLTFGTGVGSSLFKEGMLFPNLQLSHQLLKGDRTYEDLLGRKALEKVGKKKWNKRIHKMIPASREVFNWDTLYLGGGNSKHLHADLPSQVKIVGNEAGLAGGVRLWSASVIRILERKSA